MRSRAFYYFDGERRYVYRNPESQSSSASEGADVVETSPVRMYPLSLPDSVNTHVRDGFGIIHALRPYDRDDGKKDQRIQRVLEGLKDWAKSIEDPVVQQEAILQVLYKSRWAEGNSKGYYLSYSKIDGSFSLRSPGMSEQELRLQIHTAIDTVLQNNRTAQQGIRSAVEEIQRGDGERGKRALQSELAALVAAVEEKCPLLLLDLPGWAGNYMIDFLQKFNQDSSSQNNCVRESIIAASIVRRLQDIECLPSSYEIASYETDSRKTILYNAQGERENHVGVRIDLGEDGLLFMDTWGAEAGKQGGIYSSMHEWHSAFSSQTETEMKLLSGMKQSLRLPSACKSHHPDHNHKWDFLFLHFYVRRDTQPPVPLHSMFTYMKDMIKHYVVSDYKEESFVQEQYGTRLGWDGIRPFLRRYYTQLYPGSTQVEKLLRNI